VREGKLDRREVDAILEKLFQTRATCAISASPSATGCSNLYPVKGKRRCSG